MFELTPSKVIDVMEAKGHVVFKDPRGYDLNVVGVRSKDMTANTFNDFVTVSYIQHGQWNFFQFPATTDPGTYYRENPMNVDGTLIMKPGQYRGAYKVGTHRGYEALEQKGDITVYRDANRDNVLDVTGVEEQTGIFYANVHRASPNFASNIVHNWSAGCQVIACPIQFAFFMALCRISIEMYGNSISYTLVLEEDFS